jgi:hypothetical protein
MIFSPHHLKPCIPFFRKPEKLCQISSSRY